MTQVFFLFFCFLKVTIKVETLEKLRHQVQEHTFSIFTLLGLDFSLKNFCRGKKHLPDIGRQGQWGILS